MNTIAERLGGLIEAAGEGRTARSISLLAGLNPTHVQLILTGDRGSRLSATTALALARTLGCSVAYLIEGEGDPPTGEEVRAAVERALVARELLRATGTEG